MKTNQSKTILILTAGIFLLCAFSENNRNTGVTDSVPEKTDQKQYTLKKVFEGKFYIGAAISYNQISENNSDEISIITSQFNTITPENCMKWQIIHPEPDVYNFKQADRFVEFGEKNNMQIIGHILLDQVMTPDWVFQDSKGGIVSGDTLINRIKEHIYTIVDRYKGRIHAWHIVNEAIGSDGEFVNSKWYRILGEDYIIKAFEFAYQADPEVELYYNGHDLLTKEATDRIIKLVADIKNQGGRIDGIGVQGHWKLETPLLNEIERGIVDLTGSGMKIMITELDITVLPRYRDDIDLNPYVNELPAEIQEKLAKRYGDIFAVFCKHADKIDRVNFWGMDDGQSWLNNWPYKGRTDYPLLFDRNLRPKPAFYSVIEAARTAKQ
jgi:endo-1,4-beta-xylanase